MLQQKILNFLRKKDDYVSGEEMSTQLGVTRQALWKHTQELRDAGYDIVAVPHLGYRLASCPDRLFPSEVSSQLRTKFIGRKISYFDSVPSTMAVAMQLGVEGAPEGTLVIAEAQTKGRGRLGRAWFSPKYKGIYVSLILRPDILPQRCPVLTLLAAVSICEVIKSQLGLAAHIKWPNDILIQNKKIAGILTELHAETDATLFVIIGIGINVHHEKRVPVTGAASLKEYTKEAVNRAELLKEILRAFEDNYMLFRGHGSSDILEKWRSYTLTLGKRVKVLSHDRHREGVAVDIDSDGALLIRNDSGLTEKVLSGDIVHYR